MLSKYVLRDLDFLFNLMCRFSSKNFLVIGMINLNTSMNDLVFNFDNTFKHPHITEDYYRFIEIIKKKAHHISIHKRLLINHQLVESSSNLFTLLDSQCSSSCGHPLYYMDFANSTIHNCLLLKYQASLPLRHIL